MRLNVGQEVAVLARMTVKQLEQQYAEVFGEDTNANNKAWRVKRIAWRLQARAEGELSDWRYCMVPVMIVWRSSRSVVMWLNRGKRRVFYLCRRVDGKARQFLVGTGPLAEKMAAELESRKQARKASREACAWWKAKVVTTEEPLDELCAGLEQVTAATLLAQGFHRHDRGPWRKKREHRQVQDE